MEKIYGLTTIDWHRLVQKLAIELCKNLPHQTILGGPCSECIRHIQDMLGDDAYHKAN